MKVIYLPRAFILTISLVLYNSNTAHSQCLTMNHDTNSSSSWLSCTPAPNPKTQGSSNHWILYDLGEVYTLTSLHLWNYNEENETDQGIEEYDLDISLDKSAWTNVGNFQLNQAPGTQDYQGSPGPDIPDLQARYVLLTVLNNYGGICSGLSEIKIFVYNSEECQDLDFTAAVHPNTCVSTANGEIQISPTGGEEPYTYQWGNGSTDAFLTNLASGIYSVTVTDANNCQEGLSILLPDMTVDESVYNQLPIPSGAYYDELEIESQGAVGFDGNVSFTSPIKIDLTEGFEVVNGGSFYADIDNCLAGVEESSSYFTTFSSSEVDPFYTDYIGAGHTKGTSVNASEEASDTRAWYTLGGQGFMPSEEAASRFLAQATLGANDAMIQQLTTMGIENWLDWQIGVPRQNYSEAFDTVIAQVWEYDGDSLTEFPYFRMAWWQNTLTGEDYLRDRVAFALSEIFVVSSLSDLKVFGEGLSSYYDMLHKNAFGNFRDLLYDVTMHPVMGLYLSHLNNPKSNPSLNQYPDENYAREAMQLFSIGLSLLNPNGTTQKNIYGNEIPTYSNNEILEFAKIYTGLGFDAVNAEFGKRRFYDYTVPMIMYENFHEPGEKFLLNDLVVPDGQTGIEDIEDAVDNLYNHPNVGPFIGRRLIQRLVKSNPSPGYLNRVSAVFNDNGSGIRGDLAAVIKAILLDPEARDCSWIVDPGQGMLREPLVRYTHFLRAFNASSESNTFYAVGNQFYKLTFQAPLASPSVFNFFLPDYVPPGPAGAENLFGPEFQILNSYTAIGFYNILNYLKENNNVLLSDIDTVEVDFTEELAIALNTDALVERLNLLVTHGTLTEDTKNIIKDALNALSPDPADRLQMAVYLFFTSPEYSILK